MKYFFCICLTVLVGCQVGGDGVLRTDENVLIQLADSLNKAGNADSAYVVYSSVLEYNPNSEVARIGIASILADSLMESFPVSLFREAKPGEVVFCLTLLVDSVAAEEKRILDEALHLLRDNQTNENVPKEALAVEALLQLRQGSYRIASDRYTSYLLAIGDGTDKRHTNAYFYRGIAHLAQRNTYEALQDMNKYFALTKDTTSEDLLLLGLAFCQNGRYEESIATYQKALLLHGSDSKVKKNLFYALANVYYTSGQFSESADMFKEYRHFTTDTLIVDALLSECYDRMGRLSEARDLVRPYYDYLQQQPVLSANDSINIKALEQRWKFTPRGRIRTGN